MQLSAILGFVGSLFPVIFPKNEFNPKNLAAVVVIMIVTVASIAFIGVDGTEAAKDIAVDLVDAIAE